MARKQGGLTRYNVYLLDHEGHKVRLGGRKKLDYRARSQFGAFYSLENSSVWDNWVLGSEEEFGGIYVGERIVGGSSDPFQPREEWVFDMQGNVLPRAEWPGWPERWN